MVYYYVYVVLCVPRVLTGCEYQPAVWVSTHPEHILGWYRCSIHTHTAYGGIHTTYILPIDYPVVPVVLRGCTTVWYVVDTTLHTVHEAL